MNPLKFFFFQFLCILGWLFTFGALAFVILYEEQMMMVLQGWGMEEPIEIGV